MFKSVITLKIIIFNTFFMCNKIKLKTYKNDRDIVTILISQNVTPFHIPKILRNSFLKSY